MGGPLLTGSGFAMDQGSMMEGEARPFYEFTFDTKIRTVGFVTTDDGRIGCSPDGLIGDDSGIEIKCPELPQHIRYHLGGTLPKDYVAQVQGAMYVTGRPTWRFMSYHRQLSPFIVAVERDERFQAALHDALMEFLAEFDKGLARLRDIKGSANTKVTHERKARVV